MKLLGRYHNFIEPDSERPSRDGEPSSNGARPADHEANIIRSATYFLVPQQHLRGSASCHPLQFCCTSVAMQA